MKPELKLNQRLFELTSDLKAFNEEHSLLSKVFAEKKIAQAPDLENYSTHSIELLIAQTEGKVSMLKEILEIKD